MKESEKRRGKVREKEKEEEEEEEEEEKKEKREEERDLLDGADPLPSPHKRPHNRDLLKYEK